MKKHTAWLFLLMFFAHETGVYSESVYKLKPDDPEAFFFTPEKYGIRNDGKVDITDSLQSAVNTLKTQKNFGILFIPEGKYLIRKTVYIPPAIRLIGYGKTRPVFILGPETPGFQDPDLSVRGKVTPVFMFTGEYSNSRTAAHGWPVPVLCLMM